MVSDDERREVVRKLRSFVTDDSVYADVDACRVLHSIGLYYKDIDRIYFSGFDVARLADLIEPSYKPDAKYESWYNSLSHFGDKRGGPSTIRELIEEIVWAALTVDLGPNGNTDPSTGIDEGDVYTNKQFTEWEREALRLSGGCDRDALLALADEMDRVADENRLTGMMSIGRARAWAGRIREALGVTGHADS